MSGKLLSRLRQLRHRLKDLRLEMAFRRADTKARITHLPKDRLAADAALNRFLHHKWTTGLVPGDNKEPQS